MLRPLALLTALALTTAGAPAPSAEARTAAYFAAIRHDPTKLVLFLEEMPKGGDLHHHLTGAVYAESYIDYAVEDGDCIDATSTIVAPPCAPERGVFPARRAIDDYSYRNLVIDALSARNFVPTADDRSELVHFFKTFYKFDRVTNGHWGEELAEVVHRAALQHEVYLETMLTPDQGAAAALGAKVGWDDDFAALRAKLDAAGMATVVAGARSHLDDGERGMRRILACGTPRADAGCALTLRFQNQILRAFPKEQVFAQIQAGFELASADSRIVALNPVQPQDDYTPMHDFELQLRMFDFFHRLYPKVHLSFHAGELFPGLTPPEQMESPAHIRDSIEIGHAERIGHGIDVLYERDPRGLLAEMARKHILVEDPIPIHEAMLPGIVGGDVLPVYLAAGVPVALATDDEGALRSDLTQTFVRAVQGYNVDYLGLKRMVRDSLQHAFLPGRDLWVGWERFDAMTPACAGRSALAAPDGACATFLASSEKAALEWREEAAFARFEQRW
ncbi:MAG: hypothetical protein WCE44_03050 [Candidatus Velthaea sp.]